MSATKLDTPQKLFSSFQSAISKNLDEDPLFPLSFFDQHEGWYEVTFRGHAHLDIEFPEEDVQSFEVSGLTEAQILSCLHVVCAQIIDRCDFRVPVMVRAWHKCIIQAAHPPVSEHLWIRLNNARMKKDFYPAQLKI